LARIIGCQDKFFVITPKRFKKNFQAGLWVVAVPQHTIHIDNKSVKFFQIMLHAKSGLMLDS